MTILVLESEVKFEWEARLEREEMKRHASDEATSTTQVIIP